MTSHYAPPRCNFSVVITLKSTRPRAVLRLLIYCSTVNLSPRLPPSPLTRVPFPAGGGVRCTARLVMDIAVTRVNDRFASQIPSTISRFINLLTCCRRRRARWKFSSESNASRQRETRDAASPKEVAIGTLCCYRISAGGRRSIDRSCALRWLELIVASGEGVVGFFFVRSL